MYFKTIKANYSRALIDAFLAALSTVPGAALLATPKVMLWVDGPAITPNWDPGDYTEPTFNGYAAGVVTLSVASVNIGGTDQARVASVVFVATAGGPISDSVNGYALVDTTKAIPYMIERFPTPMSFGAVGDFLQLDLIVPLPMVLTPTVA